MGKVKLQRVPEAQHMLPASNKSRTEVLWFGA